MMIHKQEGYHNQGGPCEEQGVLVPHQAPQLGRPALARGTPIISGFENQLGLCTRQLMGYKKLRLNIQRVCTQTHSLWVPVQSLQFEMHLVMCEGLTLTNCRVSARGAGISGKFLWGQKYWWVLYFSVSLTLLSFHPHKQAINLSLH